MQHKNLYSRSAGNPVNLTDPDGRDVWSLNSMGFVAWERESEDDELYYKNDDGTLTDNYVTVGNGNILEALANNNGSNVSAYTSTTGINDIFKVFKFAADNTKVEWVIHKNGDSYTLGTIHNEDNAGGWDDYGLEKPEASVHSHPGINSAVSFEIGSMSYDWNNVKLDAEQNGKQTRMNYVYFPATTHLYHVELLGVRYIRNINNNYKRFYFGTLNNR